MPRLVAESSLGWVSSRPDDLARTAPWVTPSATDPVVRAPWGSAVRTDSEASAPWHIALSEDVSNPVQWSAPRKADAGAIRAPWVISARADREAQLGVDGTMLALAAVCYLIPWGVSEAADAGRRLAGTGGIAAVSAEAGQTALWSQQATADTLTWVPWGMGRVIDGGLIIIVEPGDPTDPSTTIVIPVLGAYIVINSATLTRVSNNTPIPAFDIAVSINSDAAHWTWSASVPLAALESLQPDTPDELVELAIEINGHSWRVLVETRGEKEAFDRTSLQIGGRGIAAQITDPAYPVMSHNNVSAAIMARQAAEAALSINGVPLGWILDWQAADWLLPSGVWVHSGTPLNAVVRIAEAAGAYVQAAPDAMTLRVLPKYPIAPWDWATATPGVVLPASAVLERGTDHVSKSRYNAVYVVGQAQGIRTRVKRVGTAGDVAAQTIIDPLITHADAARGRGLSVLGDTGMQQRITLDTGILPASGVIHVGTLMDWTRDAVTRRGLVRSLAVRASIPSTGRDPIQVRQTIVVETHG